MAIREGLSGGELRLNACAAGAGEGRAAANESMAAYGWDTLKEAER